MRRRAPASKVGVGLFTGAYLAGAGAWAIAAGNGEFVFYIAVMVLLIAGVWAIDRRVRFPGWVLWALSTWGLLHMAGGLVPVSEARVSPGAQPVLYSLWLIPGLLKYDQAVHFYGFGVATLAAWECMAVSLRPGTRASIGLAAGAALMGMGLGSLNEVVEFAATRLMPETNVGGYENTAWDLVANALGAGAAGVVVMLRGRA